MKLKKISLVVGNETNNVCLKQNSIMLVGPLHNQLRLRLFHGLVQGGPVLRRLHFSVAGAGGIIH